MFTITKLYFRATLTTMICLIAHCGFGQGCSDAGFCTINGLKPKDGEGTKASTNQVKIGAFVGRGDNSISVYGNYLEYNKQLTDKLGFDVKLTTLAQTGNGISAIGLSDLFVNTNYAVSNKLKCVFGAKIPLSKANRRQDGLALPMDYQASLGTFDLILGLGYDIHNFQLVAAIQQPLTQNGNQFFAGNYPATSALRGFQTTNNFQRSGDILVRLSYPFDASSKLKITPSMLPIYHLANDKFTDEFNVKREIIGSQGLTLNGNLYLDYEINNKNILQFNVGVPFVVRDSRPDGLTRSFVASLEYRIRF